MDASTHQIIVILAGILGGGLGVNLFAQLFKKAFKLKADGVIHAMVVGLSVVAMAAQYVVSLKAKIPPEFLGVSGTSIYGFSQLTFKTTRIGSNFLKEVRDFTATKNASVVAKNEVETALDKATTETVAPDLTPAAADF